MFHLQSLIQEIILSKNGIHVDEQNEIKIIIHVPRTI